MVYISVNLLKVMLALKVYILDFNLPYQKILNSIIPN